MISGAQPVAHSFDNGDFFQTSSDLINFAVGLIVGIGAMIATFCTFDWLFDTTTVESNVLGVQTYNDFVEQYNDRRYDYQPSSSRVVQPRIGSNPLSSLPVHCPERGEMTLNAVRSSRRYDLRSMTFNVSEAKEYGEDDLKDCITFDKMEKPVIVCQNDHTMDLDSVQEYVNRGNTRCPLCRQGLDRNYPPNLHMYIQLNPNTTVQDYLDTYNISR